MTCTGRSAKILFQSSLQDFALRSWGCSAWSRASPCQKIVRKSWRSPFDEILSKRSLRKDLANTCKYYVIEVLPWSSCKVLKKVLYQDLVRSAPGPFQNDFVTFFLSWQEDSGHRLLWQDRVGILMNAAKGLCMILRKSLWKILDEVLVKSFRCPYLVSYRCLWEDFGEILLKSSWSLHWGLEDALHWCLYGRLSVMLMGHSCMKTCEICCINL